MTENQQQQQQVPVDSKYLPELMAEKDSIDPSFVHAVRLISNGKFLIQLSPISCELKLQYRSNRSGNLVYIVQILSPLCCLLSPTVAT